MTIVEQFVEAVFREFVGGRASVKESAGILAAADHRTRQNILKRIVEGFTDEERRKFDAYQKSDANHNGAAGADPARPEPIGGPIEPHRG